MSVDDTDWQLRLDEHWETWEEDAIAIWVILINQIDCAVQSFSDILMKTIVIDFRLETIAQLIWPTVTQHFALVTSLLSRACHILISSLILLSEILRPLAQFPLFAWMHIVPDMRPCCASMSSHKAQSKWGKFVGIDMICWSTPHRGN